MPPHWLLPPPEQIAQVRMRAVKFATGRLATGKGRPMQSRLVRANIALWHRVNERVQWHKLPAPLQLLNLRAYRDELRELNLYDQAQLDAASGNGGGNGGALEEPVEVPPYRTYDGAANDPLRPEMGRAGSAFGRNHPLGLTVPEVLPRLMTP